MGNEKAPREFVIPGLIKNNQRNIVTAIPLILVNSVAVIGQYSFLREHLAWNIPGTVMFAGAIETVAIYLAYMAHVALLANDSSLRLRLAAYAFGLLAGLMNYTHYAHTFTRPDFVAVATGVMSASSPWLWAVYSHRQSRDALAERGLIETHSVRLGFTRWIWHPIKSAHVFSLAAWSGEQNPQAAIINYETARPAEPVRQEPAAPAEPVRQEPADLAPAEPAALPAGPTAEPARPGPQRARTARKPAARKASPQSKAQAVRVALAAAPAGATAGTVAASLAPQGIDVSAAYVRAVKSADTRRTVSQRRGYMRAVASGASSEHEAGETE